VWLSASAFRRGLYAEHHEELAFLYDQITRLRSDEATTLSRIVEFEARLVAHLDALVIGDDLAAAEVLRCHDDEAPGHWYAAALLACARRDRASLEALLARASARAEGVLPEALAAAFADALRHAMPIDWATQLPVWIGGAQEPLRGWLADAAAARGMLAAANWSAAWLGSVGRIRGREPSQTLMLAFGRAGVPGVSNHFVAIASQVDADPPLRAAALHALAVRHRETALELARDAIDVPLVSHRLLGLCGDATHAAALLRCLDVPGSSNAQTLLALGLIGALPAVRPLIGVLARMRGQPASAAAATALHWITGAGLTESVSAADAEADEVTEDEQRPPGAGDPERTGIAMTRLRPGAAPLVATTERALPRLKRLSRDPDAWSAWLVQAAGRFQAGQCYRFGVPQTARALADALADEAHGATYRAWAAEEIVLRWHAPHRLDLRATSGRQERAIGRILEWAAVGAGAGKRGSAART